MQVLTAGLLLLQITPLLLGQTINGNANGEACYFPFTYEGLVYTTCIDINHDKPWCSTTADYNKDKRWGECLPVDLASLPNFDTSTPQNVTVYQGETARLPCTVHNMQDKKVSWFRKGLTYPLAVSTFSFLSDGRHVVENNDEQWNLIIKDTTKDDSGIYLCRVMTQTMLLAREITLNVLDHPATVAPAVSLGDEPIIYVTKGMELRLQCNSTGGYERNTSPGAYMVPPEVEWFKGDGNKIDSHSLNNVVIHNQIEGVLLMSTLVVEKAQSDDAGVYICRNTGDAHAEVTVRVLNDDRGNKKRGTASDNPNTLEQMGEDNSAVKHFSSVVLILGLLICNMT